MSKYSLSLFVLILLLLSTPITALAAERVALVIGNSAYQYTSALANPINDANAISKKLKGMGYSVSQVNNADLKFG